MNMDLAGAWLFALDRADCGEAERWYLTDLSGTLQLPGSLQAQGYGDEVGLETPWVGTIVDHSLMTDDRYAPYRQPDNFKTPSWLQPEKYYCGVAWVQRTVTSPDAWRGRRITLTRERPHWETTVWLADKCIGRNATLATGHVRDVGAVVAPANGQHGTCHGGKQG